MKLLAIDTSASFLSAAISYGDEVLHTEIEAGMRHSELAMDCIAGLTGKAGLKPGDLDGVLCMGGPGSFTGLRIGFSIAKGLALALGIPFAPIPTLDCIAMSVFNDSAQAPLPSNAAIMPVITARKNAFFCALYRNGGRISPILDASAGQIVMFIKNEEPERLLVTGPGSDLLFNAFPEDLKQVSEFLIKKRGYAEELIKIAKMNKILDNNSSTASLFEGPEYIRRTDAELNL